MPLFPQIAQFFPVVLAPGVVALVRRQRPLPWLDGPVVVWLAVCGAAVLWAIVCGLATGESFGPEMVRRGLLLGLVSACAHTLATGKGKPAEVATPPGDTPSEAAPTLVAAPPDVTPAPPSGMRQLPAGALSEPWGPQ